VSANPQAVISSGHVALRQTEIGQHRKFTTSFNATLKVRFRVWGSRIEPLKNSRRAFTEKRMPVFKDWNKPEGRFRMPTLNSVTEDADRAD
jgi:hypothetical protein